MSTSTREEYHCDKCEKKLPTHGNKVVIQTNLTKEWDNPWSRLQVTITHHHGFHNDAEEESADLCQKCAIEVLTNALKKVKAGVRMSAGVETIDELKFNQTF